MLHKALQEKTNVFRKARYLENCNKPTVYDVAKYLKGSVLSGIAIAIDEEKQCNPVAATQNLTSGTMCKGIVRTINRVLITGAIRKQGKVKFQFS